MNVFTGINENFTTSDVLNFAEKAAVTDNIYREFILSMLLKEENLLSYVCERVENSVCIDYSLKKICLDDMKEIFSLFFNEEKENIFKSYVKTLKNHAVFPEYENALRGLTASQTPTEALKNLIDFYLKFGGGEKSKYISYRWENGFHGVKNPDKTEYSDLVNIDFQKSAIIKNTTDFINGRRANNILLAGDSGTGKSSLVKATLNEFYINKLRLVEMEKQDVSHIREIFNAVAETTFKYIIFIDDLSFEENEREYKEFKSILDGKTEKQPENILFYVTSNRRHIIKETWEDRSGSDVRVNDTKNETISLSERFGLHITFFSLSKEEYLACVKSKCERLSIEYNEEIEAAALKFAARYNGFSGRTAEQFINSF